MDDMDMVGPGGEWENPRNDLTVEQGCKFVPYTNAGNKPPQMVPTDLNIGFQGLALSQIYNPVQEFGCWITTMYPDIYRNNSCSFSDRSPGERNSLVNWFEKSHRIHVWYIYLHLVDSYGRCRKIYTIHGWYGKCVFSKYRWWFRNPANHHPASDGISIFQALELGVSEKLSLRIS